MIAMPGQADAQTASRRPTLAAQQPGTPARQAPASSRRRANSLPATKAAPAPQTAPAPQADKIGSVAPPTKMSANPNSKRYRWDGQMWWYYHPSGKWSYWNGTAWMSTPISGNTLPGAHPSLAGVAGVNLDGEAFRFEDGLYEENLGNGEVGYEYERGNDEIGENN
jgi:hypothetical protein